MPEWLWAAAFIAVLLAVVLVVDRRAIRPSRQSRSAR